MKKIILFIAINFFTHFGHSTTTNQLISINWTKANNQEAPLITIERVSYRKLEFILHSFSFVGGKEVFKYSIKLPNIPIVETKFNAAQIKIQYENRDAFNFEDGYVLINPNSGTLEVDLKTIRHNIGFSENGIHQLPKWECRLNNKTNLTDCFEK